MTFNLPELPYKTDALQPYISARTLEFHHGKHHRSYVENLNKLIKDTEFASMSLEDVIRNTADNPAYTPIFNNAAQAWNHQFLWQCMQPNGGAKPDSALLQKIEADFGSYDCFRQQFKNAATSQFGSGWAWLVEKDGHLEVIKTANADTPLAHGYTPLLTLDVWEHAYYLDYQNRRVDYVDAFIDHLLRWPVQA